MTAPGDGDLVRAVLGGDTRAYAALVDRYQAALFRRALSLLGEPDLAADMVQDAFVRAYAGLEDADPDRFGAWIHRIVRNLCLDDLRSPRRRASPLPPGLSAGTDPERDLGRRELGHAMDAALAALGPTVREAFIMKHLEGLSYEEMTAQTGVSVGALKMRVKRAREALQSLLQPMYGDGHV
jgi:RNA polymerase sigma-70 factor, ECF subfamily